MASFGRGEPKKDCSVLQYIESVFRRQPMNQEIFSIPNISCGHCTAAIQDELAELEGVSSVQGDVASKTVTVGWGAPADRFQIIARLRKINYPAAE